MRNSDCILFASAGLLLTGGLMLSVWVAWSMLRMSYYFWLSEIGVELICSLIFLAAGLLCLPACWLATLVPYYPKSVVLHGTLMSLLSVAIVMVALGMTTVPELTRAVRDPAAFNSSLHRAMAVEPFVPAIRSSFAAMQVELKCCGVSSYADWFKYRSTLPVACCGRHVNAKRGGVCEVPLYDMGCLWPALTELRSYANSLSVLSSALVVVLAVSLVTTAQALVRGVLKRSEWRSYKPQQLRIACLTHAPPCPMRASPPLVSLTAPAALPSDMLG